MKGNDLLGRQGLDIPTQSYTAGEIVIPVNAPSLTKGVYIYTVTVNGNSITKKMVVK